MVLRLIVAMLRPPRVGTDKIADQRKWIEEHGGSRAGYVERDSAPSNRNCWRAPPERGRNAGGKKTPRYFSSHERGRGGAGPDPHTCRSRNPPLETRPNFWPNFFGKKFWEIKIVLLASPSRGRYASSRSDSAAIGQRSWHRWSISRTAIELKRKRRSARLSGAPSPRAGRVCGISRPGLSGLHRA